MKSVRLLSSQGNWECQCFWWASVILDLISFVQSSGGREKKWGNPTYYTVGQNPQVISNDA